MNEKQRKKAVKELREKIIPKIKARNLANDPDKNLKGQGVYEVQAIFTQFDSGMGKELGDKIDNLLQARRKERESGQTDRTPHTMNLANDILNYITLKTKEMDHYRIKENNKGYLPWFKRRWYYNPLFLTLLGVFLAFALTLISPATSFPQQS